MHMMMGATETAGQNGWPKPKAAEDCRTPRRFASTNIRQVLECGSPLPLSFGGDDFAEK